MRLARLWRNLTRRSRIEGDLREELNAYLEALAAEKMADGMSEAEARRAALIELGGAEQVKEHVRDVRTGVFLEGLWRDAQYAVRSLSRNAGFVLVAIWTLALGIGATTAIFSVVNAVLLRPLAYRQPDRLFAIYEFVPAFSYMGPRHPVSAHHFLRWRRYGKSFEALALLESRPFNMTGTGEPERVKGARVSPNLFRMLGIQPAMGRTFRDEEERPEMSRVVVLTDGFWHRRFDGDPEIVGKQILLDGAAHEVVGVLPPVPLPREGQLNVLLRSKEDADIWTPFSIDERDLSPLGDHNYAGLARLKAGVSADQATAEMNSILKTITAPLPDRVDILAGLIPMQEKVTGDTRGSLLLLMAAVGSVMLIICVNLSNLLLSRNAARRREIAIRASIGAGTGRLVRQVMTESLVLAAAGGLLGFLLAHWALRLILASAPVSLPRLDEVRLDGGVLWFGVAVTGAAGLLSGLIPAWRYATADPLEALKSRRQGTTDGRSGGTLRALLVGVEVAVSTACLVVAALLLHSFVELMRVDRGFEVDHVLTVALTLPEADYREQEDRTRFTDEALARVSALAGVDFAGITNKLPLDGEGGNNIVLVEGKDLPLAALPLLDFRWVSSGFFPSLSVPLVRGRLFADADRSRHVTVISAAAAEKLWPGEEALGKRFRLGGKSRPLEEVIGIVGDVKAKGVGGGSEPTIYLPYWQRNRASLSLVIRTRMDPGAVARAVRREIRAMDAHLPIPVFRTMTDVMAETTAPRRFQLELVMLFALTAVLLASMGIYGVVSYGVSQRQGEIGVRLALGASTGSVRRLVLAQGLKPVALGLVAGLGLAVVAAQLIRGLLFGVGPLDLAALCLAPALLLLTGVVACSVPARRAVKIDPITALRAE